MDTDLIKTVAEVVGATLTTASVVLTGATGRVQRLGLIAGLVAIIPWVAFAVVTTSWLLIVQSFVALAANSFNLHRSLRRARLEAP